MSVSLVKFQLSDLVPRTQVLDLWEASLQTLTVHCSNLKTKMGQPVPVSHHARLQFLLVERESPGLANHQVSLSSLLQQAQVQDGRSGQSVSTGQS